jgi:hypothetical protein
MGGMVLRDVIWIAPLLPRGYISGRMNRVSVLSLSIMSSSTGTEARLRHQDTYHPQSSGRTSQCIPLGYYCESTVILPR